MSIYLLPNLISAILILSVGLLVFLKNAKSKTNIFFSFLCIILFIWNFAYFIAYFLDNYNKSKIYLNVGYSAVIFITVILFHFVTIFLNKRYTKLLVIIYSINAMFLISLWYTTFFVKDIQRFFWGYYPIAGIIHPIFIVVQTVIGFFALYILYRHLTKVKYSSSEHKRIKYIFWALTIGFISSIDYLPNYRVGIYPIGSFFLIIFISITTYAIIKHKLLDIEIFITRATVFAMSYGFTFGLPFVIFSLWRQQVHSIFNHFPWAIPATVMCYAGMATITPFVYIRLENKAKNIIFAKQRHYQKLLLESSKTLLREHSLNKLLNSTVDLLKKTVKINFVAIFLKDQDDRNFVLKVVKGDKGFSVTSFSPDKDSFIKLLKKRKSSLAYDEINPILNSNFKINFQLIVPIFIEDKLVGFLGLGEKEDNSLYTEDDINVFEILSRQVALAIDHCKFLEEFSQTQEKIFQAEKLASIGGMADGVAHQIKNRLNFFSIVSGEIKSNADEFMKANAELVEKNSDLKNYINYISEIGDSLINNVRKTNSIIEGILSFARTGEKGTFFSIFSLKEIIDTALGLLLVKHHINHFPLMIEDDSSDIVYGVKSQILECIYNILDNCYEAIKEKIEFHLAEDEKKNFKPIIQLQLKVKGNFNVIEICDNGIGIKEENRQKIFAPFFTTKPSNKSGTGIGMYVVKRIIEENHQGSVRFESEYMKGTKFFIKIPKNDSHKVVARIRKSDLFLAN